MGASVKTADFTNVKERSKFNRSRIPAGDYLATIVSVDDAKSKKSGAFQYEFAIKLNKRSQSVFPYYCQLEEKQLWKLRNLLIAAGINVPKSRTKIDPNKVVNRQIGVTIEDADDYNDREQSELTAVFPASELTDAPIDDDDDDDAPEVDDDDADDSLDELDEDEPADEEEAEEEAEDEEEEAAEGDEWDAITDRLELRKALKKVAPDIKTSTKQSDDDIRDLIREHTAKAAKPTAKPAAKKTAAKKSTKDVSDDELDELDLDDL